MELARRVAARMLLQPVASSSLAVLGLFLVARQGDGADAAGSATRTSLATLLEQARKNHSIPAMAAVATRAEALIEVAEDGFRHDGRPELVTSDSRFHIGSNGKAMTATVVSMLVEKGELAWDATPLSVFPEWRDEIRAEYRAVTLADLLTHHAGLPAYTDDESPEFAEASSLSGTPTEQRRAFALLALRREPAVVPRTTRFYSNGGYSVAAAMAERASREGWESQMRTRLFEPLDMRCTFDWPASADPEQTWGHIETSDGVSPHDPRDEYQLPVFLLPAGAVSITPSDYAKFLRLHLKGLRGSDGLLAARSVQRLHEPLADGTALGWGVREFEGAQASVHSGSAGTFFAVVAVLPSRDLGIAVFANSGGDRATTACGEVLRAMAHRY